MKYFPVIALLCMTLSVSALAQDTTAKRGTSTLTNAKDKISYSIGASIGRNFKIQELDLNLDIVFQGIRDMLSGGKLLMEEQEISDTMMAFQKATMERQKETAKKAGEKSKKEGEEFLAANKTKDSVVTLPDGLQYKILRQGDGQKPTLDDTVSVHYRGYLVDGKEFDNSYKREKPTEFPLNHVIPGWSEALQLMTVGSKWQVFIPSELGYGERGMPQAGIPPNAVLIFDVELLSFR